jgi:hypothetical protein
MDTWQSYKTLQILENMEKTRNDLTRINSFNTIVSGWHHDSGCNRCYGTGFYKSFEPSPDYGRMVNCRCAIHWVD